jgi:uncharacterized protein (UPF0332 family)
MDYNKFIKDYLSRGLIKKQPVGFDQINSFIIQSKQELKDCNNILEISAKVAYSSAYTAMLYAARALMLLAGYRPAGVNQHKTVIEFVGVCAKDEYRDLIKKFDLMRKKRNLLMYEPWEVNVSPADSRNALNTAAEFIEFIIAKIKKDNPQNEFEF